MKGCENCGTRLAPSAEFCANCGEERAGYAYRHFARATAASPAPLLAASTPHAVPLVRLLSAAAATLFAAAPWLLSPSAPLRVPAALGAGIAILALGRMDRGTIAGLLRPGHLLAWAGALLGAAIFVGIDRLAGSSLPAALRLPPLAAPGLHPVTAALALALLPATLEGIALRGLLLEALREPLRAAAAHGLCAAAAAALYARPEALPSLLLFALFLGYIREKGRSLLPAMAAHAAYNLGAVFLPGI